MPSIQQRGPASFRVLIRRAGQRAVCRTFKTREEAEAFAQSVDETHTDSPTVAYALGAYRSLRKEGRRPVKHGSNEDFMLRHLERDLGRETVSALTPQRMRLWAARRASEGAGGYTVGMELSKLGTALFGTRLRAGYSSAATPSSRSLS